MYSSLIICDLHSTFLRQLNKGGHGMLEFQCTERKHAICTTLVYENLKETDHLGKPGVEGRIIDQILENSSWKRNMG
jgi:hypothetical protein